MPLFGLTTVGPPASTVPAGTVIAVDQIVGNLRSYQYVKLAAGAPGDEAPIQGGANGLYVDVRASVAVPVTGVFWPVTQPISGNVGITGSVAVTGTFWQATQPVSVASLPLPAGAATAAKQPALGAVGTISPDVLTVQGTGTGGAIPITGSISAGGVADASTFTYGPGGTPSSVTPAGYVVDDTTIHTTTPEDGIAAARIDPKRAQILTIEDYGTGGVARRVGVNVAHELLVGGTGTAGAPSIGIVTVQGDAGGVGAPLRVMPINVDSAAFVNGNGTVYPIAMERNDLAATDPGANSLGVPRISQYRQQIMVIEDGAGTRTQRVGVSARNALAVEGVAGGTAVPVSGTVGITGTVPVSGTFWQATQPISGSVGVTGSVAVTGTFWQTTQPVSIAAAVATNATIVGLSGAAVTGQKTMVASFPVVLASDQTAIPVTGSFSALPAAGAGWTPYFAAALTSVVTPKSTAATIGGYTIYNPNAAVAYVQVFNHASPSLGTTVPVCVWGIPAGATANVEFTNGIALPTAFSLAATAGPTNNVLPTTGLVVSVYYR